MYKLIKGPSNYYFIGSKTNTFNQYKLVPKYLFKMIGYIPVDTKETFKRYIWSVF